MIAPIADGDVDAAIALWRSCGLTRPWNDPREDIARVRASDAAEVLVGHLADAVAATVMVGYDGHRGWVYYLAVDPTSRLTGLGRAMMAAAEAWLRHRGAPKIQLMVREENAAVAAFYERLGYEIQSTRVLGKWLRTKESDAPVNFVDSTI